MEALLEQYRDRISEQQKAYQSLEDEFRMALRIETGRFQELHRTYQQVSAEVESSRETAIAAVQKEQKANGMIMELTSLVKEQKGRIVELSRSKQEALSQMKVTIPHLHMLHTQQMYAFTVVPQLHIAHTHTPAHAHTYTHSPTHTRTHSHTYCMHTHRSVSLS